MFEFEWFFTHVFTLQDVLQEFVFISENDRMQIWKGYVFPIPGAPARLPGQPSTRRQSATLF